MGSFGQAWKKVDKGVFFIAGAIAVVLILWCVILTDNFVTVWTTAFNWLLLKLGWMYVLLYTAFVVILLFLAFSKFGRVRLGEKQNDKPEFKTFTWVAMMFAAGQGVGLTYYALSEGLDHYYQPPWGVTPCTPEAIDNGLAYTLFHFGPQPWAGYAILGLCIAYFAYNKKAGGLISTPLAYVFGKKKNPDGTPKLDYSWAKAIDIYAIIVSLLGVCASLFLASEQIAAGFSYAFGLEYNTTIKLIILGVATVIFTISSGKGVSKGMKFLSDMNMYLCYIMIAGIIILGPTIDIANNMVEGIGHFLRNYVAMSFFMDANGATQEALGWDWLNGWTTFWWAYYLAWVPFVGIFVAKASKGRTIKQFVMGALLLPSIFCFIWIYAFGTTGIILDQANNGAMWDAITYNFATCLYALYDLLPLTPFFTFCTLAICCTFILTSADSANYTVSVLSCRGEINPPAGIRVFWGIIIGGFALVFLLVGGASNMQKLQFTATGPLLILMVLLFVAFWKQINKDWDENYRKQFRLIDIQDDYNLDESIDENMEAYMGINKDGTVREGAEDYSA